MMQSLKLPGMDDAGCSGMLFETYLLHLRIPALVGKDILGTETRKHLHGTMRFLFCFCCCGANLAIRLPQPPRSDFYFILNREDSSKSTVPTPFPASSLQKAGPPEAKSTILSHTQKMGF